MAMTFEHTGNRASAEGIRNLAACRLCTARIYSLPADSTLSAGVAQPKAIVEGIDFNGDGTLTSPFSTVSINGVILRTLRIDGILYCRRRIAPGTITFD